MLLWIGSKVCKNRCVKRACFFGSVSHLQLNDAIGTRSSLSEVSHLSLSCISSSSSSLWISVSQPFLLRGPSGQQYPYFAAPLDDKIGIQVNESDHCGTLNTLLRYPCVPRHLGWEPLLRMNQWYDPIYHRRLIQVRSCWSERDWDI